MAKKHDYGQKSSPFKILLFLAAAVILLAGIVYLVKCTREKQAAFEAQIEELKNKENETLTEEEQELSTEALQAANAWNKVGRQTETESAAESETETESETELPEVKQKKILVLNGSGQDGVAAKWEKKLTKEGYEDVSIASYPASAIEHTRIYTEDEEEVEVLAALFDEPEVTENEFTTNITLEDGSKPKDIEIYVVIGRADGEE